MQIVLNCEISPYQS